MITTGRDCMNRENSVVIGYLVVYEKMVMWFAQYTHKTHTTGITLHIDGPRFAALTQIIARNLPRLVQGILGVHGNNRLDAAVVGLVAAVIREDFGNPGRTCDCSSSSKKATAWNGSSTFQAFNPKRNFSVW